MDNSFHGDSFCINLHVYSFWCYILFKFAVTVTLLQECPTGIVNEDTFKDIYAQFFPQGGKYFDTF